MSEGGARRGMSARCGGRACPHGTIPSHTLKGIFLHSSFGAYMMGDPRGTNVRFILQNGGCAVCSETGPKRTECTPEDHVPRPRRTKDRPAYCTVYHGLAMALVSTLHHDSHRH